MKKMLKRGFVSLVVTALVVLALPALAKDKSEAELIADLSASKDGTVTSALLGIEKKYPTSTNALPIIKKLLSDPRMDVRVKAARVLGSLHTPLEASDIQTICNMLKSTDKKEKMEALKSLRGLSAPSAVTSIVPLLKDSDAYVIRDACRTLAVLGTKAEVSAIEPLLQFPDPKVQKDAMDAIAVLKAKP